MLYTVQACCAIAVNVPAISTHRRAASVLHGALAVASMVESILAYRVGDTTSATTRLLLALACLKEALVQSSSRSMSSNMGILTTTRSVPDAVSGELRRYATRYKLGSNGLIASVCVVVHALLTNDSFVSSSPLTRELARVQAARTAAFVALLASVGAEDASADLGGKKAL
jgi:hypothetical protein